jgi:AcrR family transcriptional regulator
LSYTTEIAQRSQAPAKPLQRDRRKPGSWATTPAKRRRILDAALDRFEEKGISATTIDDICAAAGLHVGSIYHHFAGKDDIFEHLAHEALTDYLAGVVRALEGGKSPQESIRRLVAFHVRWVEERPALTKLMLRWEETERDLPSGREHYAQYSEAIGVWLRREAHAGRIRRMEPDLYSTLVMGPLMEHARQRSAGLTIASPPTMQRGLVAGLLRVLINTDDE